MIDHLDMVNIELVTWFMMQVLMNLFLILQMLFVWPLILFMPLLFLLFSIKLCMFSVQKVGFQISNIFSITGIEGRVIGKFIKKIDWDRVDRKMEESQRNLLSI